MGTSNEVLVTAIIGQLALKFSFSNIIEVCGFRKLGNWLQNEATKKEHNYAYFFLYGIILIMNSYARLGSNHFALFPSGRGLED